MGIQCGSFEVLIIEILHHYVKIKITCGTTSLLVPVQLTKVIWPCISGRAQHRQSLGEFLGHICPCPNIGMFLTLLSSTYFVCFWFELCFGLCPTPFVWFSTEGRISRTKINITILNIGEYEEYNSIVGDNPC